MSEHDYTTYILADDVQEIEGNVDGEVVYIQGLTQEDILNGVTVENLEYADAYEVVDEVTENNVNEIPSRPTFRKARYDGYSGYWTEDDVHRLLKVYLKHIKKQPMLGGKPNVYTWKSIMAEFDVANKFTRMQVKTKIARLRKCCQELEKKNHQSISKWPYWKPMSEVLSLERNVNKPMRPEVLKSNVTWTNEDLLCLLKEYRHHLGEMVQCTSNSDRRAIWNQIAQSLRRPRYQVSLKFQTLKAKWRRWKRSSVRGGSSNLEVILSEMNKVMAAENVGYSKKKVVNVEGVAVKKVRNKWSSDCTEIVLKMYEEKLRILKASGVIKTRRAIYKIIAEEIKLPLELVQVKIASAKGHYKKLRKEGKSLKKCKWHFAEVCKNIVLLERQIWLQLDESSEDEEEERTKHSFTEPSWFRQYRTQVEKRHQDNIQVLSRLLEVLETIAKS